MRIVALVATGWLSTAHGFTTTPRLRESRTAAVAIVRRRVSGTGWDNENFLDSLGKGSDDQNAANDAYFSMSRYGRPEVDHQAIDQEQSPSAKQFERDDQDGFSQQFSPPPRVQNNPFSQPNTNMQQAPATNPTMPQQPQGQGVSFPSQQQNIGQQQQGQQPIQNQQFAQPQQQPQYAQPPPQQIAQTQAPGGQAAQDVIAQQMALQQQQIQLLQQQLQQQQQLLQQQPLQQPAQQQPQQPLQQPVQSQTPGSMASPYGQQQPPPSASSPASVSGTNLVVEKKDDDDLPSEDIDGAVLTDEMKARAKASHTPEEEASQGGQLFRNMMARAKQRAAQQKEMPPQPHPMEKQPVQIPPNAMDLSVEEQARLFREIMNQRQQEQVWYGQQQQQQQGGSSSYAKQQLPTYPYGDQAPSAQFLPPGIGYDGRKIGRNKDAEMISTSADVYLAQLKRDSSTRRLAREAGDHDKANAIFHDPKIQDIKAPVNPYMEEQRAKERDMLETVPEEMLLFQEYGEEKGDKPVKGDDNKSRSYSGVSFKDKLAQRKAQRDNDSN